MAVYRTKIPNLLEHIISCLEKDEYKLTHHAIERLNQRDIELPDILHVLRTGYHEKIKDTWDLKYNSWNYSIRGKTTENDKIRVIVSFDENGLLIITVIKLG